MPRLKRRPVSGCAGVYVLLLNDWINRESCLSQPRNLPQTDRPPAIKFHEQRESKRDAGEKCLSALCHVYIILQDKLAGSFRKRKALFTHCRKCKPSRLMGDRFVLSGFSCWGSAVTFFPNRQMFSSIIANVWYHVPSAFEYSLSSPEFKTLELSPTLPAMSQTYRWHDNMGHEMSSPSTDYIRPRGSPEKNPAID